MVVKIKHEHEKQGGKLSEDKHGWLLIPQVLIKLQQLAWRKRFPF